MGGVGSSVLRSVLGVLLLLSLASSASAFEFAEGRVQVHGFYEAQVRSMVRDFDFSDRWDLTQWYNVLNIEVDWDVAPDGIGPLALISAFGRVEVRYDCVWSHACGTFPSANAYGSRGEGPQPLRLRDGHRSGYSLQAFTGDTGRYQGRDRFAARNIYELGEVVS